MAMQGKLVDRDGALHVLYQTTFDGEPVRRSLYWKVIQTTGNPYGHERPAAGDSVRYNGSGHWVVTSRSAGSVKTGDGTADAAFVEDTPVPPPARGKELRWYQGRWQRLSAKGWIDAGEGSAKSRAGRSHGARLDAEIAEVLSHPPGASDLRVGQLFDHLGHIYEITKIGRDKKRTVQIARRIRDSFGKETLIDHRLFPASDFDRQHLRPLDLQTATRRGWPPLVR
jgi:hypothetical protein